jgi:D-alanyl-D-alanine carboxypeptidase
MGRSVVNRRGVLKVFSLGALGVVSGQFAWRGIQGLDGVFYEDIDISPMELSQSIRLMTTPAPDARAWLQAFQARSLKGLQEPSPPVSPLVSPTQATKSDHSVAHYQQKMLNFEAADVDDVFLDSAQYPLLISAFKRMGRVQRWVGHGNFNVISVDEMLGYAAKIPTIGAFSMAETAFLDELFTTDARRYGFYGDKVISNLTHEIPRREIGKISRTGHFLFHGDAHKLYKKLMADLGQSVELTSGIRSVVKQSHLFMAKTIQATGNLSRASRSLAPPGYSFHGIGDFDVGKVGFGAKNFTEAFAHTPEFKRLFDLGYIGIRYPKENLLGVRYEPWHIKVV